MEHQLYRDRLKSPPLSDAVYRDELKRFCERSGTQERFVQSRGDGALVERFEMSQRNSEVNLSGGFARRRSETHISNNATNINGGNTAVNNTTNITPPGNAATNGNTNGNRTDNTLVEDNRNSSIYTTLLRNEIMANWASPSNLGANAASQIPSPLQSPFQLTPISPMSQRLLSNPTKPTRKVNKLPYRTLEAPSIQDDFYLHLVDWSSTNVLAVGLTNYVYLWHAHTSQVTKLCDLGIDDTVTAVSWMERGTHLAVAASSGKIDIYDVQRGKRVRQYNNHRLRVGTMCWSSHILSSGSRDRVIYNRDVRTSQPYHSKLQGHKQEVCGLEWSSDGGMLASGGNDNLVLIWDCRNPVNSTGGNTSGNVLNPTIRFTEHAAAVKALAWSPHQRGLLASGGGTADRTIRFWNTQLSQSINKIDTESQVCNIAWSKNVNELVSTHGYSQNQIIVWDYPSMNPLATLTGHTMRILYLSVSPDGTNIVTGAGDETLRFWNIWPPARSSSNNMGTGSIESRIELR